MVLGLGYTPAQNVMILAVLTLGMTQILERGDMNKNETKTTIPGHTYDAILVYA